MESYSPAEQGGYKADMSSYDRYHCWAATQYREKVDKVPICPRTARLNA